MQASSPCHFLLNVAEYSNHRASPSSPTLIIMGPLNIANKSHFDEDDAIVVTGENVNSIFGLHIAQNQWSYWDLAEEEIISIPRHLR